MFFLILLFYSCCFPSPSLLARDIDESDESLLDEEEEAPILSKKKRTKAKKKEQQSSTPLIITSIGTGVAIGGALLLLGSNRLTPVTKTKPEQPFGPTDYNSKKIGPNPMEREPQRNYTPPQPTSYPTYPVQEPLKQLTYPNSTQPPQTNLLPSPPKKQSNYSKAPYDPLPKQKNTYHKTAPSQLEGGGFSTTTQEQRGNYPLLTNSPPPYNPGIGIGVMPPPLPIAPNPHFLVPNQEEEPEMKSDLEEEKIDKNQPYKLRLHEEIKKLLSAHQKNFKERIKLQKEEKLLEGNEKEACTKKIKQIKSEMRKIEKATEKELGNRGITRDNLIEEDEKSENRNQQILQHPLVRSYEYALQQKLIYGLSQLSKNSSTKNVVDKNILESYIKSPFVDINFVDKRSKTPLIFYILYIQEKKIGLIKKWLKLFMKRKGDINSLDDKKLPALYYMMLQKRKKVVKLLLQQPKTDIDLEIPSGATYEGNNLAALPILMHSLEMMKFCLKYKKDKINFDFINNQNDEGLLGLAERLKKEAEEQIEDLTNSQEENKKTKIKKTQKSIDKLKNIISLLENKDKESGNFFSGLFSNSEQEQKEEEEDEAIFSEEENLEENLEGTVI